MSGYTKLFSSILASTVWREDDKTRIVWITLLAMAGKNSVAEGSIPGLADFARVSIEDCQRALKRLSSPDEHSRTKDRDGRRIEEVEGGWRILNHAKYREKMNADERREYFRLKKRQYRSRSNQSPQKSTTVQECPATSTLSTQSETETETETDQIHTQTHRTHANSHRQHAWCGSRFCVPFFLNQEFENQLGPVGLQRLPLFPWYEALTKRFLNDPITGDPIAFVRQEFRDATKKLFGHPKQVQRVRIPTKPNADPRF